MRKLIQIIQIITSKEMTAVLKSISYFYPMPGLLLHVDRCEVEDVTVSCNI